MCGHKRVKIAREPLQQDSVSRYCSMMVNYGVMMLVNVGLFHRTVRLIK